jgi:hypothetical protein
MSGNLFQALRTGEEKLKVHAERGVALHVAFVRADEEHNALLQALLELNPRDELCWLRYSN